jgi:hypothetical protein
MEKRCFMGMHFMGKAGEWERHTFAFYHHYLIFSHPYITSMELQFFFLHSNLPHKIHIKYESRIFSLSSLFVNFYVIMKYYVWVTFSYVRGHGRKRSFNPFCELFKTFERETNLKMEHVNFKRNNTENETRNNNMILK